MSDHVSNPGITNLPEQGDMVGYPYPDVVEAVSRDMCFETSTKQEVYVYLRYLVRHISELPKDELERILDAKCHLIHEKFVPEELFGSSLKTQALRTVIARDRWIIRRGMVGLVPPMGQHFLRTTLEALDALRSTGSGLSSFWSELFVLLELLSETCVPLPGHTFLCALPKPDDQPIGCSVCQRPLFSESLTPEFLCWVKRLELRNKHLSS